MKLGRWLFAKWWWLGAVTAGWGLLMFSSAPARGFDRFGVWQLEATEAARSWLDLLGSGAFEVEAVRAGLVAEPFGGPLNGLLPGLLWRLTPDLDAGQVTRLANMILVSLTAWCLFSLGRRAGGALAGLGAAVALIAVPRIWGAATTPGLTAPALFAITFAAMTMARAGQERVYVIPAVVGLAIALLTTQLALLLLLPWLWVTFVDPRPSSEGGFVRPRALSLWAPLVFPIALGLLVIGFPPFRDGGVQAIVDYLKAFVTLPREPTLYFDAVYGERRLPWHAAFALTGLTVPPTVLVLSVVGLISDSPLTTWVRRRVLRRFTDPRPVQAVDALRLIWAMFLLTMLLPLLLGTTRSHGVDLLALVLPWCAVFAGVGLSRLLSVVAVRLQAAFSGRPWARLGTLTILTTLGWGAFAFALKDAETVYPEPESYYNWFVNGVDGAAEMGLPRYPNGPLPAHFLARLDESDEPTGVVVIPEVPDTERILQRYVQHGLVPSGFHSAPLEAADLIVFRFDESVDPDTFFARVPDVYASLAGADPDDVTWFRREGLPLFVTLRRNSQ